MLKKTCFIILIILLTSQIANSQESIIDSLKVTLTKNPSDSLRIKTYSDLCWYYRNVSIDSAFVYGNYALMLSEKTGNSQGEAQAYNDIGILHYGLADYESAMQNYRQSLSIRKKLNDTSGIASIYNKMGLCFQNTFKLDSAIYYNTRALEIYESQNNLRYASALKGNIANIYRGLKQYDKALHIHLELANTAKEIDDKQLLTRTYNNIANAYLHMSDTINSIKYFKLGIEAGETHSLDRELGALYNNYGSVLSSLGQNNLAIENTIKSLAIRMKIKDNQGIASASLNLGDLYLRKGDFNQAKTYLDEGLRLAEKHKANELRVNGYNNMSYYYAYNKNIDSVNYYQVLYRQIEDSIFNNRITKEVAEVQEKYNANEREKEILTQRAELAEKERDLSKKNSFIIGLIGLAIVLTLIGFIVYNQQKLKNVQLQKENELKDALLKIETQNRLQEQRLRISRDLHDNIGAQLTFIISSLDNLKYGFDLPKELNSKLLVISSFTSATIHELRDTIWAMNKNEIVLEDLQVRISNFIEKANTASDTVDFVFHIDDALMHSLKFSSIEGMNIYRIIQEATNNALKYANPSKINVSIKKLKDKLVIEILDNGKGFKSDEVELGNGLNNMRKRANEINADFDLESSIEDGTKIIVSKVIKD